MSGCRCPCPRSKRQDLPSAGSKRHELPFAGSKRHDLPSAGSKRHELPFAGSRRHDLPIFARKFGKSCLFEFAFPFPGSVGRASAGPARRTALDQAWRLPACACRLPLAKPAGPALGPLAGRRWAKPAGSPPGRDLPPSVCAWATVTASILHPPVRKAPGLRPRTETLRPAALVHRSGQPVGEPRWPAPPSSSCCSACSPGPGYREFWVMHPVVFCTPS